MTSAQANTRSVVGSGLDELSRHTPRRDIQGLRGVAVLLVVAFHAGLPVPGGFIGVDVFFVISGFVITAMLMREYASAGRISLSRFYQRRLRRLLPALAVVVTVTLVATALLGSPFNGQQEITALTGGGAALGVANIVLALRSGSYFATPPTANPLLNTWSLSVEEQFYLVFPFVLIIVWWLARRMRGTGHGVAVGIVGALALASFVLSWIMSTGWWSYRFTDPEVIAFYSSPTRAWEFAAGALIALMAARISFGPRGSAVLHAAGIVGILVSAFIMNESTLFPGTAALVPVAATTAAIVGGTHASGPVAAAMRSPSMVWSGDVSYSWYLWHWPLIAFAALIWPERNELIVAAAVLSLGVGWVSFRYIENPLRFDARLKGRRLTAMVVICLAVSLGTAAIVLVGSRALWWNADLRSMDAQVSQSHVWLTDECNSSVPLGMRSESCSWNAEGAGEPIYLVGDSQAGMLAEGYIEVAEQQDRTLLVGTKGGCPFLDAVVVVDGSPDDECRDFVDQSTAWLETAAPGTVVLGSWAAYMWLDGVGLGAEGAPASFESGEKERVYEEALTRTVQRLVDAGHRVVVLSPIPGFPEPAPGWSFWYPYQCSTISALATVDNCGVSLPRDEVEATLMPYRTVFEDVVAETGGTLLDLTETLCSSGTCRTNAGDQWTYMDGQHITVGESARPAPLLAAVG